MSMVIRWTLRGLVLLCVGFQPLPKGFAQEAGMKEPVPNPLARIDPSSLAGFRDRPLFSPSRTRPADPAAVEEAAPEPVAAPAETVNIRLLGVVGTPAATSAHVLDLDDDTRHVLHAGEMFRGWTVSTVDAAALVMTKAQESMRFPVFSPTMAPDAPTEDDVPPPDTSP